MAPAPLPKAPAFLEGVVPYEGRGRAGRRPPEAVRAATRRSAKRPGSWSLDLGEQRVGVLVDEVREVMRVDSTTITAPGPMVSGLAAAYIAGIVTRPERTIIILNARKLLSSTERLALSEHRGAR